MKALCYNGINSLAFESVPVPLVLNPHDAIVKVKLSSISGVDLHVIDGYVPTMKKGDILGQEFIGEVIETGDDVKRLKVGDRVVVGSVIGCGECQYCKHGAWSLCDNSNPHSGMQEKVYGYASAGIFGYSHTFGGYAGSHAEYIRVPFADQGAFKVPENLQDEQALFCSDAFPAGYMAADMCDIVPGDIVAVWGCGAVGQMAIKSAYLMGAERVIAIDQVPERLMMAQEKSGAEVIVNFEDADVLEAIKDMTGGRGPDKCIDAVGMEAHKTGIGKFYDKAKEYAGLQGEHASALREAIMACGKGGIVSVVGTYGGEMDKFPLGAVLNKGLVLKMGHINAQKYIPMLLEFVQRGIVDPSYLLTHKLPLEKGAEGFKMFKEKSDSCMRVAFAP